MGSVSAAIGFGRSAFEQLDRWRWILWYHRPEQLARRLYYHVRDRIGSRPKLSSGDPSPTIRFESLTRWADLPHSSSTAVADQLAEGRLTLLNLESEVHRPIDWEPSARSLMPPLWEFHFQYQEYLLSIADRAWNGKQQALVQEVVNSWLDCYEYQPCKVAWHPYCISRRIWVWFRLLAEGVPANSDRQRWIKSLVLQIRWLERRLERDLGGNHLWENARAMSAAGVFFKGPLADRWWKLGSDLMQQCIADQLLPWGEHYERSPMYQADLARGLRELSIVSSARDPELSQRWSETARRMGSFLNSIRHPNGSIPLFGDSSLEGVDCQSSRPAVGRHRSEWVGDYYVHRVEDHQLVFDAGNLGPDELPAHAHADLLGYELSAFGEPLIVDSGTHSYTGSERTTYRATLAHNVLMIDGTEVADTWSSFRMGRRGHVTRRDLGRTSTGRWVRASHDGYSFLGIREVTRFWFLADEGPWFCIDIAESSSRHVGTSLLHFAPRASARPVEDGYTIRTPRGSLFWRPIGQFDRVDLKPSSYAPKFYSPEPNQRWEIRSISTERICVGWGLSLDGRPFRADVTLDEDAVHLQWNRGERNFEVLLPRG